MGWVNGTSLLRVNTMNKTQCGDKSGTLLFEHPFMVGAPRAALSLFGRYIFSSCHPIYWGSIDVVKFHLETIYCLF